jgi:outer membrane lipoprotein-sorting protein
MQRSAGRDIRITIHLIVFALFICGATERHAVAYDLSADTVMVENGRAQEGRIYIKGDKYRIERNGESECIIIRHDKQVMWVMMPQEKVYVELPLDEAKTPRIQERSPGEVSRKFLGAEDVDDHPSDKYEIILKEGSRTESFYQWTATDINFPIKTAAPDGKWLVEFRNIKQGIPDSLFEVPADYQKVRSEREPSSS